MPWLSIQHAYAYWLQKRELADPQESLEEAEEFILAEPPNTTADAVCILDVVCANAGDVRCDGLDQAALWRVKGFLTAQGR